MKILYYLEPHPIRNGYEEFLWVGNEILAMIERSRPWERTSEHGIDMKIHANARVINRLMQSRPWMSSFLIDWEDEPGKANIEEWFTPWDDDGIQLWESLMTGKGEVSDYYVKNLESVRDRYDFDVLVHWGTNGAVEAFCDQNDIAKVSMESGFLRNPFMDSVVFDPRGVNGNSSICQVDYEVIKALSIPGDSESELQLMGGNSASTGPLSQRFELLRSQHAARLHGNRKVALIALQLRDDSNMILFSDFNSSVDFLKRVLPPLVGAGYVCVVKPHPGAPFREINQVDHDLAEEYVASFEDAIWCDDVRAPAQQVALLGLADVVVTTNSSLGFEATLLDKIVCLEGTAAYAPKGMFPSVAGFLSGGFDLPDYLDRLRYLRAFLISNLLHEKADVFNYHYFCNQVVGAVSSWHEAGKDPVRYCSEIAAFQQPKQRMRLAFQKYGRSERTKMEWSNETLRALYEVKR